MSRVRHIASGILGFALIGVMALGASADMRELHGSWNPTTGCALTPSEAHAEDDFCATWWDKSTNRIVVGPLWAKP